MKLSYLSGPIIAVIMNYLNPGHTDFCIMMAVVSVTARQLKDNLEDIEEKIREIEEKSKAGQK